jgi:hypothetical protein
MDRERLIELLKGVQKGNITVPEAAERLRHPLRTSDSQKLTTTARFVAAFPKLSSVKAKSRRKLPPL